MKHFSTRKQLVLSVLSLLLCVSMLVGSTFAWFTDSVTSGMNTIAAGNLDIELLANGVEVDSATKLFDDVALWEPGVVVYENLQVANVGTLALKYQMTLNFGNENDLNGHKLSEVLKIAVVDAIAAGASRADVLAAAKASSNIGTLSNFYVTGALEAGVSSNEQAIVIFWEPNSNEIDNLYNANNGQTTSDGLPLHIEFGINLVATQQMSEEDSFGNDYDEFASILPKAEVNNVIATYPSINATNGIGGTAEPIELDVAMQFQPNETADEGSSSAYKYWHADYVLVADKDVAANSIALAGYYSLFCDGYNGGNWVALTSDTDIAAGTEIRLMEHLGATVNYSEICLFGNDGIGFLCGAKDLGGNGGTTLTVELRLYETTVDPVTGAGNKNIETGYYEVIGTYTHTFPAAKVSSMSELKDAAAKGGVIDAQGANLGDFYYDAVFADGTVVKNATFSYFYGGNVQGTVVFENCVFESDHSYSANFDSGNGNVIFNNCTFDGWSSFGSAITNVEMNNCTFLWNNPYSMLRFYQNAQLNNCEFVSIDGIDCNESGCIIELTNCTGIAGKIYNNGSTVSTWIVDGVDISSTITSW